jgi:predicted phage terminase large subunit-like protein
MFTRVSAAIIDAREVFGTRQQATLAGRFEAELADFKIDPQRRIYLLDLWRKQSSSAEWIESFCDLVEYWRPSGWAEEQGQIKAGIGPFLDRRISERQTWVQRKAFPTRGDKAVRAQSIRGRMELVGLYVPAQAHWYPAFLSKLLNFPAGKHDDQVDALGLIGQVLDRMGKGTAPPDTDEKIRFMNGLTMDETWELCRPKRPDWNARI